MKRYLRFFLIFVISLALPLSGMAGVQAPTEPCPMQDDGHGDDGRHGAGLLQRHGECKKATARARQTLQAGPGVQDWRHAASVDGQTAGYLCSAL
jgi:hypothetical protein